MTKFPFDKGFVGGTHPISAVEKSAFEQILPEKISEPKPVKPGTLYNVLPDGHWEFFFDNYTITTHTTCEQKFEYSHIEHLGTPGRGFARDVGIWWHECMAFFYKAMQRGKPLSRGDFVAGGLYHWNQLKMEEIEQFAPKQYQKFDGRNGAVVMLDRYYDVGNRDQSLFDIVAVESGFGYNREVLVGETDKVVLYYTGRPDLIIKMKDSARRTMPLDHKSIDRVTGNENKMFKPHGQTAGYIFTTETLLRKHEPDTRVDRCVINICARQEPSDKPRNGKTPRPRFTRVYPGYSRDEIEFWRHQKLLQAESVRHSIENNEWIWKESSCHLYSGCEYRRICAVPAGARDIIKKSKYVQVAAWKPYGEED